MTINRYNYLLSAIALTIFSAGAAAQSFNNGLPTGWTTVGTAGTSGADGVVTLSPAAGSTAYGWVSTAGSTGTAGYGLGGETNGSSVTSAPFVAAAGAALQFYFNYVTSDGGSYADYGYANLLDATTGATVAVLFNARTSPSGTIAPGQGLPLPQATLSPSDVPIIPGAPTWSPLQGSSGQCYDAGCGYTGWIQSSFNIVSAGTYELQFGVTNWTDTLYDSGLAFDGITVAGAPITPSVPEPATYMLIFAGLGAIGLAARRHKPD